MKTEPKTATLLMKRLVAAVMAAALFVYPLTAECEADSAVATPHPIVLEAPELFAAAAEGGPTMLQIDILDGEGALNNIRQRTAREPIVQVKDENHKPVAGALILFTVHSGEGGGGPLFGPAAGASFNGAGSVSMYTDADGRAVGHGLTPNSHTGEFTITVTAVVGAVTAFTIIHQRNIRGAYAKGSRSGDQATGTAGNETQASSNNGTPKHHLGRGKIIKLTILGAVVVVTVVLVYVLTRGHATTVTAGTGTVAGP